MAASITTLRDEVTRLTRLYVVEKEKVSKAQTELQGLREKIAALHAEVQWCRESLRRDVYKRMSEVVAESTELAG